MNFVRVIKILASVLALTASAAFAQTSWKGTTSTNWYDATNWTAGVPATNTDTIIGDVNFTGAFQPTTGGTATANCRSLTLGGAIAATLNVKYTLTAYSNIVIAANGTLIHNTTKTLTVKGSWTNSGSYIATNTSALVAFGGTTNQTINGTARFAKLTINSGSATTLNTNVVVTNLLTVSGTLNPNESPTFTVTGVGKLTVSGTLQVKATTFPGNYPLTNTITLNAGSTVEYAATNANQTIAGNLAYSTLRISGTNTIKSLTNNLPGLNAATASRGLLYLASGTLDLGDFTANRATTTNGGTLTIINGAKLRLTGTNNFPTNYTTYTINAAGTVEYAGTNQLVVAKTYGNLTLTNTVGAGSKLFPATNFTIAGNLTAGAASGATVSFTAGSNLTVSGSTLLAAGATFNGGTFTLTNSGNWTNNGTFTGNASTVVMNGASTRFAGSGANNFFNLTIAKAGVTNDANTALTIAGNLATITSATFVHTPGGTGSVTMSGAGKTISGGGTMTFSTLAASGTITTTNSLTIAGDLNVVGSFSATTNTVTLSGTNKSVFGGGTIAFTTLSVPGVITTTNNFSLTSSLTVGGSLTATAGTASFLGTTTLSGTANLFNATLNGTKLQLGANSILGIAGALTLTAGTFDVTTTTPNTVNFNGAGAQTINATTYNLLTLSGGGTKSAAGSFTNNSDFTISSGATYSPGANTHTVNGNFINSGTFTAGSSTVQLLGSANTYVSGVTTFNTLVVNKSATNLTVSLSNNLSVATLNFTNGVVQTLANALTLTSTRNGGGIILGTITRTHAFANGTTYAFEGTNNTVNFASGAGNVSSITVNVSVGSISDFPFGGSVNRQYTVTPTASGAYAATLRLHYNDSELNGNTEASMNLWRYAGSSWSASGKTANDSANNYVEQSSLSDMSGRWTFSDNNSVALWNGSVSTAWETAANWSAVSGAPSLPPSTNDIVQLGTSTFTSQPAISSAASVKSITFGSAQAVTLTVNTNGSLTTIGNVNGSWTNNTTHTLNLGNQNLTVGGSLALSDGTNSHAINLNVSNGVVNITGSLTESGGANVTFTGAGALTLGGDFTYASGTFTPGSSTFTYNGSTAQTVGGVTYNQLVLNKSGGTATLGAAATANASLLLTNAATLTVNAALTVATNVVIQSGTTLNAGSATISVGGNWTNNGTFSAGTSTVLFNGTGTQNNVGTNVFNHFTVNKSAGVLTLVSNISLNGNMTISAGTLDLGAFTANRSALGGTLTLASNALLRVGNSFPANFTTRSLVVGSTVEYNGSTAQSVSAETYGHLTLTNGTVNAKTLAGAATVAGDLVIHTNANFDASSFALAVSGNWANLGTFTPSTSAVTLSGAGKFLSGATTFNQLTVSGSYTAVSNVTVNATATLSGSFDSGSTTNIFSGDFVNSGTFSNGGQVNFSGTNAQNLTLDANFTSTGWVIFTGTNILTFLGATSPNFQNVGILNTAGISPVSGWNMNGDFGVTNGATFSGGTFTHNFSGNFTNSGTFTSSGAVNFTPTNAVGLSLRGTSFNSSGTVTFGGSGQISIFGSAPVLDYVVIANTHAAGITPSANWNLADDLTINGGSLFNGGTFTHTISGDWINHGTFGGGTSTIKFNSATLIGGANATTFNNLLLTGNVTNAVDFTLTGSFTNNGTFDAQGFTVTFNGASAATIAGSTTPTSFDTLVIAKTSVAVTQAVNVTASANLIISSGTLDSGAFTLAQETSGGALSVSAGATLKLGGNNSFPTFDTVSLDPVSTVEYNGALAQIIGAQNYGHLTSSSTGARTLASSGTIGIAGTFTLGANSYTVTNSTVNFNGGGAQTIPAFNFFHLTASGAGARTLANSGTVGVGGTFTPGANSYTVAGSTVSFNGSSAQTIPVFGYNHLTTAGSGTKTLAGSLTVGGNISLGSTLADGGFILTVNGDTANTAAHTGTGEILLSGSSTNHVVSGGGAFQNLELSDTNGAVLNGTNLNVNGTLTLTTGKISTSTNRVVLAATANLSRTNGYVIGWLQKPIATGAVRTNIFELGDTTAFAPVGVVFSNVTVAGAMLATVTNTDHADIANSGIAAARSVNRNWTLTNNTATFGTASATFSFVTNDVDTNANNSLFIVAKKSGGTWTLPGVGAISSTNFTATGLTNFGDFQIGESSLAPGLTSQPASVRVNLGLPASFSVTASGAPVLTYQWRQSNTNVNGATNVMLNFASTIDANAGSYAVVVTNANGAVTSSVVTLTLNHAPALTAVATQTINEIAAWNFTNSATDADGGALTYSLLAAPSGASMTASGVISWTPTEAQGPSTNTVTVQVSDDGSPALTDTKSFTVVVNEVNAAPVLTVPATQTINELTTLNVSASATDNDLPANTLTFALVSAPSGVSINASSGAISWTPSEAQGPSTNTVTVRVTDNGSPNLSATNSFTVIVNEVNSAPSISVPATQTVDELTALNVTVSANDNDVPANTLTFALVSAPSGVSINSTSGLVSWTPTEAQGPSTNTITVRVTDSGSPNLSATNGFTVIVSEVNAAPSLTIPANQTLNELTTLTVSASATDSDLPTNTLTFSLDAAPSGMTINASSGAISWTPSEAQGPSTNTVTVRVTDNGSPNLSDAKSFTVTVNEVNTAPTLNVPANQTLDELTTLNVSANATDSDLPANTLTFAVVAAPSGLTMDASSGAISWTPSEAQGPSTNTVTVRVTDNGSPSLSATNSFTVIVNEVNAAPTIVSNADVYMNELTTLTLTNVASDADLPANTLTFSLATAPIGMNINSTNGVLTWTPTEAQGPSINPVDVVVTDNGSPMLSATNHFTVLVSEVNTAPVLSPLGDVTLAVNSNLSVTATATDVDLPANTLTFSLVSAPAGMRIGASSGVITWSPTPLQRPSSNYVTVRVTDNSPTPLSDTQSFIVRTVISDDVTTPTVAFVSPLADFRTNSTTLVVTGTANDNRALARVRVSVNGGAYADATGTNNWSATVALDPGTNIVAVFSEDASGNISSVATRNFFRVVTARLTVNYFGSGTASPNLNGSMLELNRSYTITAQPQPDWLLTNWTGGVTSSVAALTFTMTTNLIINANFVSNPIVVVAGNYNALFAENSGATVESAGFVSVTLSKSGAFSAAMQADGRSYALAGVVGLDGHGSAQVSRPAKTPLTLDLQFDLNGGDAVTGSVSSLEWNAPLLGDRVIASTNFSGKYTLLVPGSTNAGKPAGFGYATVSATNSSFTLVGALADGTALKQTVAVSKRGDWPVFIPLYSGPLLYTNASPPITLTVYRGALIGWAHVTSNSSPTVSGSFVWLKNACTNGNIFTNGFEVDSTVTGARYNAPATGGRAANLANGVLNLSGGGLAADITANFTLSTANAVTFAAPNANKCALTLTPATGLVKLTFTPAGTTKARTANGVILQDSNVIGGSFVGTNATGSFTAQPQ